MMSTFRPYPMPLPVHPMMSQFARIMASILGMGAFAVCASAQMRNGVGTPQTYCASFSPVTEIAQGNEPYTLSTMSSTLPMTTTPGYYLQVALNDPVVTDYPMTVTFRISN